MWFRKIVSAAGAISILSLACVGGSGQASGSQSNAPIKIGISVSLSGDFSADGKTILQGYQLWADTINKKGCLLGRQAQLDILSDATSTQQDATTYQKLITLDHVDLVLRPFSTLLTQPSPQITTTYNYPTL